MADIEYIDLKSLDSFTSLDIEMSRTNDSATTNGHLDSQINGAVEENSDIPNFKLGNCLGTDTSVFYLDPGDKEKDRRLKEKKALSICADCVIRTACRDYARERHEYGTWGGETERERAVFTNMPLNNVLYSASLIKRDRKKLKKAS